MLPVCDNSTNCVCEYNKYFKYDTCNCPTFMNPYFLCNQTVFQEYHNLDLIYYILGIIIFSTLFLSYTYEFIMDIIQKKITPVFFTKGVLILLTLVRIIGFSLWIISSNNRTGKYASIVVFLNTIGIMILVVAVILIVISWLVLVINSKNLVEHDKNMNRAKLILGILTCIIVSFNIIMLFLVEFTSKITILVPLSIIGVVLLILLLLATFILSLVYLVIILRWLKTTAMSDYLRKIQLKSYWLIAVLSSLLLGILLLLCIVVLQASQIIDQDMPAALLTLEIVNRFTEMLIIILMFFFLERNFLRAVNSRISVISTSNNLSKRSSSKHSSSKESSKTAVKDLSNPLTNSSTNH